MSRPTPPPAYPQAPHHPPRSERRLVRSYQDRWIGGVCGGIAAYTGVDATVIRLLAVLGTILGAGSLIVVYLIAWAVMPRE